MNAYKRHGHTWSDVLDISRASGQLGKQGRLAGNAFYLKQAAALRREHAKNIARAYPRIYDIDPITWALRYIRKAADYRKELNAI